MDYATGTIRGNDEPGDEMAEDAGVWRVYNDAASHVDDVRTEGWRRGVDNVALFAGLFSAVTTAFIIESYKNLKPDFTELTFNFLSNGSSPVPDNPPNIIKPLDRAVNCVWLASLLCSLSAALIAVMGKEWIAAYELPKESFSQPKETLTHRQRAELRQFRCDGVSYWGLEAILLAAPFLMQISLLLFIVGLGLFFYPIDLLTGWVTIGSSIPIVLLYLLATVSPVFAPSSPFRSVLTPLWRHALVFVRSHLPTFRDVTIPFAIPTLDPWSTPPTEPDEKVLGSALSWLAESRHDGGLHAVLNALGDLSIGPRVSWRIYERLRHHIRAHLSIQSHHKQHGPLLRTVLQCANGEKDTAAGDSLFHTLLRNKAISGLLDRYKYVTTLPLNEEVLLALCARGSGVNDMLYDLPSDGTSTKIHTSTLRYLVECAAMAKDGLNPVSIALRILSTWRVVFRDDPEPVVEPLRQILREKYRPPYPHRGLYGTGPQRRLLGPGPPYEHTDPIKALRFVIRYHQDLGLKPEERDTAVDLLVYLLKAAGGFATGGIPAARTILDNFKGASLNRDHVHLVLSLLPSITQSQQTSQDVAQLLPELLMPDRTWFVGPGADRLLARICILLSELLLTAPLRLNDRFRILEALLPTGSLTLLVDAHGNRFLDLIHALATFLARRQSQADSQYQRYFQLFVSSTDDRKWILADELPRVLIGGLRLQLDLVRGTFSALLSLRNRGHGGNDYWRSIAQGVHERSQILSPLTLRSHQQTLINFYKDMHFVPPPPALGDPPARSLLLRERVESLLKALDGTVPNVNSIAQGYALVIRSEHNAALYEPWALEPALWTQLVQSGARLLQEISKGGTNYTFHQTLALATQVASSLCLLKRRGRPSKRRGRPSKRREPEPEDAVVIEATQVFLTALSDWLSQWAAGFVKAHECQHLAQHCVELQPGWCTALDQLFTGNTGVPVGWVPEVETWLVKTGPCTQCPGLPPLWQPGPPPGRDWPHDAAVNRRLAAELPDL